MIVREIKTNTEQVLKSFDYFNDYKDTRAWCVSSFPEILPRLDKGHDEFCNNFYKGGK